MFHLHELKNMSKKKLFNKNKIETKIGEYREAKVMQYYRDRGWHVTKTTFAVDVHDKIDIECYKNGRKPLFIQVKGFHDTWKNDNFDKFIESCEKLNAWPIIVRINGNGRMYFWNAKKKGTT